MKAHHHDLITGATTEHVVDDFEQLCMLRADKAAQQHHQGVQMTSLVAGNVPVEVQQTASYGTIAPYVSCMMDTLRVVGREPRSNPITPDTYSVHS